MAGLFVLILLLRLWLQYRLHLALDGFPFLTDEEALRVNVAWRWAQSPSFNVHPSWLPLTFWLFGSVMKLSANPAAAAMFLCVILGAANLILLFLIGRRLFPEQPLAALAPVLFAATSTMHLWTSLAPTTDALFTSLILAACLTGMAWSGGGGAKHKWLAILFLNAATLVRYEGFLFSLVFLLFCLIGKRSRAGWFVFAAPVLWALDYAFLHPDFVALTLRDFREGGDAYRFIPFNWDTMRIAGERLFAAPFAGYAALLGGLALLRSRDSVPPDPIRLLRLFCALPFSIYLLLGFLVSLPIVPYHLVAFETLLCLVWGSAFAAVAARWPAGRQCLLLAVLALTLAHSSLRKFPAWDLPPGRDRASERLGLALLDHAQKNFAAEDAVLFELPEELGSEEKIRTMKYGVIWQAIFLPRRFFMDRRPRFLHTPEGLTYLGRRDNPSLFDLSPEALAAWLQERRVRLVVAQNRQGEERMRRQSAWAALEPAGSYRIFYKAGDPAPAGITPPARGAGTAPGGQKNS